MRALQFEGKIILSYCHFEIRVYFHPYYNMTLGYKSLGLVVVLFQSQYLPFLMRKFSFTAYTCAYAYVVITSPWHLTRGLVTVTYRYSTALCFHENCQLVVIVSRIWDDCSPLFLRSQWWLNTFHIGESLHNGDTKVSHYFHGYEHPILWLHCALQPLGIRTLSQAYALVRINPHEVG